MRRILAAVAALTLSLLMVVSPLSAQQVHAITVAPGLPNPLAVLPSVVKAGANFAGTKGANALAVMLWQMSKTPAFWNAAAAVQAATATPSQVATVASSTASFKMPATVPSTLLKTVGGVGTALVGFDVGGWLGNGTLDLIGYDAEGAVCGKGGLAAPLIEWAAHVDCSAFHEMTQEAIDLANSDVTTGIHWPTQCVANVCFTIAGMAANSFGTTGTCVKWTGALVAGTSYTASWLVPGHNGGGSVRGAPFSSDLLGTQCNTKFGQPNSISANANTDGWQVFTHATQVIFTAVKTGVPTQNSAPAIPTNVTADPDRFFKCTLEMISGLTVSALSDTFTEGSGEVAPYNCPAIPEGETLESMTITEEGGGETHVLANQNTTPEYQTSQSLYPECSTGTCMLDLVNNSSAQSCFAAPAVCADWFSDPAKSDNFTCKFGTHVVALSECNAYAPTFKPDAAQTGIQYGDPSTGTSLPGSGQTSLGGDVTDPETNRVCFPQGWAALNPVEWVLQPVKCALEWAFVPRASVVQTTLNQMTASWSSVMPGQLATTVGAWVIVPPGSGCGGITVDVWFLGNPFQIMQACPGDILEPVATWARIFGNLTFTVYGVIAVTRHVGRIFGYGGLGTEGGA